MFVKIAYLPNTYIAAATVSVRLRRVGIETAGKLNTLH